MKIREEALGYLDDFWKLREQRGEVNRGEISGTFEEIVAQVFSGVKKEIQNRVESRGREGKKSRK